MSRGLKLWGAFLAGVCYATAAGAADYPRLMWKVSDDELAAPLGAIINVAVDADGTVYLLDSQVKNVRRIASDGSELPAIGREGEGPGEIMHPCLVAADPSGGCIVVQDFHAPAVCFTKSGGVCAAPDLSVIRDNFATTAFMGVARLDGAGNLFAAALTSERRYDPARPDAELGNAISVFRIKRGASHPDVLFTNSPVLGDKHTVRYGEIGYYPLRCWDVDATGRLIYADPTGRYRVLVGHPSDGNVEAIELQPAKGDEEALAKRAKAAKVPVQQYSRIVDVQWIGRDHFLVKPTATATDKSLWPGGVVEIFDLKGKSLGRREIARDYDHEQDSLFLRGSVLVIVQGGESAMDAALSMSSKGRPAREEETITVEAYDLTPR